MKTLYALALITVLSAVPVLDPKPVPQSWNTAGQGQAYLLYKNRPITAMSQGQAPSCVGCAAAKALEIMHGVPFSAEWIYAESRSQFGKTSGAGSQVSWAGHTAQTIGVLPAMDYGLLGYDLTAYDPELVRQWSRGPPQALRLVAAMYKSEGYIQIRTWEQLRGAISSGFPVIVGSNVGFGPQRGQVRSETGNLRSRWWSRWNHAQVYIGVSDMGNNKGVLVLNSWGTDWVTGPKRFGDEPDGSYWISKADAERMIRQQDTYVILPIKGFK